MLDEKMQMQKQDFITDQDVVYALNDLFSKLPKDSPTRKKLSVVAMEILKDI